MALVAILLSGYFLTLTILEILSATGIAKVPAGGSLINAFVLATLTATYLKGVVVGRESYTIVASLVATIFSLLMLLTFAASGSFSFAIFGLITVPYLLRYQK